ncbi:MAG: D-alanine--D-alanine ligase [Planctomycetes bacterium]|nr:D-alanine--D-alanine ligase [Planctomycetota bacterium]
MSTVRDIAVLAGGCSPEQQVSLRSGAQVLAHLDRERFRVWPVRLEREGGWSVGDAPVAAGDPSEFPVSAASPVPPGVAVARLLELGVSVVFPVLHGPLGEDGTVQGMLDLHGLPYVGSGCAASAVAMDKIRTREVLTAHGVPMAPAYVAAAPLCRAVPRGEAERIGATVGFPCFLKVDVSGSSLGVARAEGEADVAEFLRVAPQLGRRFLAERAVQGEEISVPVLGNAGFDPEVLPPIGIYPRAARFFDHAAKYDPGATDEVVPPRGLDAAGITAVQQLARTCHEVIGCDGLSRVDMMVTADGPLVLEVNTMPGFTRESLYPKSAAAHGIDYRTLLSRLIDLALELAAHLPRRMEHSPS